MVFVIGPAMTWQFYSWELNFFPKELRTMVKYHNPSLFFLIIAVMNLENSSDNHQGSIPAFDNCQTLV
jgi:hypothetical protein